MDEHGFITFVLRAPSRCKRISHLKIKWKADQPSAKSRPAAALPSPTHYSSLLQLRAGVKELLSRNCAQGELPESTHSPGILDRRPGPVSSPADHYHNTHASPTTRTHPALTSRGIHHTECSASASHLRSSAPPLLRHSTAPRGKHACASTHTSVANAPLPLPAFF